MGGTDLNLKKSWHPQLMVNQRRLHDAEQAALKERKLTEARLEEIRKERQIEETQKQLEAAGGTKRIDRVDWMYSGPSDNNPGGDAYTSEAFLLGKRRVDTILVANESKRNEGSKAIAAGSLGAAVAGADGRTTGLVVSARDTATKMREDPLVAIKRKEQAAYEEMMKDPAKKRRLMKELGMLEDVKKENRRESGRSERSHRHHHRHRSSRHHRDYDDRDDDYDRGSKRRRRSDSRDDSRSPRSRNSRRSPPRDRSRSPRRRERRRSPSMSTSRSPRRRDNHRERRRNSSSEDDRRGGRRNGQRHSPSSSERSRSPRRDERYRRESPPRRRESDRRPDRSPRRNGRSDDRRPSNGASNHENDNEERARKLAAMQSAATELDAVREARLKAMAESDRAERDLDNATRSKAMKYGGGERMFRTGLHQSMGNENLAERLGRGRTGLQAVED